MRRTPQSRNSPAKRASCEPLVVRRQFVERAAVEMARQRAHQRHHIAPDQRFAAGQPQLAHALGDEGRTQPVEFLERQQVGLGQEGHVFRHAIEAAQVAAVGDRYPQIADRPAERIGHRTGQRCAGTYNRFVHSTDLVTATAAKPAERQYRGHNVCIMRPAYNPNFADAYFAARVGALQATGGRGADVGVPEWQFAAAAGTLVLFWQRIPPVAVPLPPDWGRRSRLQPHGRPRSVTPRLPCKTSSFSDG